MEARNEPAMPPKLGAWNTTQEFQYLFRDGPSIPAPYPSSSFDASPDSLFCEPVSS